MDEALGAITDHNWGKYSMTCTHLQKLYELCDQNQLQFSSSDLVRIVCKQCEREEVCPSVLVSDYDAVHGDAEAGQDNRVEAKVDQSAQSK